MTSPDQGPDDPSTFVRLPGCSMKKDPCYQKYAEALQCLDKNDYQHDSCAEAFQAFTDCRKNYATVSAKNMTSGIEQDPLFGPLLKLWNSWSEGRKQAAEEAAAAAAAQQQQLSEEEEKPWRRKQREQVQQQQQQQQQQATQ